MYRIRFGLHDDFYPLPTASSGTAQFCIFQKARIALDDK